MSLMEKTALWTETSYNAYGAPSPSLARRSSSMGSLFLRRRLRGTSPGAFAAIRFLALSIVLVFGTFTFFHRDSEIQVISLWPAESHEEQHQFAELKYEKDVDEASKNSQAAHSITSYPDPTKSEALLEFWNDLVALLNETEPTVAAIRPAKQASNKDEPVSILEAKPLPRLDLINMTEADVLSMKKAHTSMMKGVEKLGPSLPYLHGTRGIVMSAGGKYFGEVITSIRMLRRTGSQLPVEVFLDSRQNYDAQTCETTLPAMNARCYIMEDVWKTTPGIAAMATAQSKVFALLFSSFEDVMFLDADAFPVRNPDNLLTQEPYASRGLVTWPDASVSTTSHWFYEVARTPMPLDARRSTDSSVMLFSKRIHSSSLLMATYYNYFGPKHYYPLISQASHEDGYKETFLQAAMVWDESFYDVKTPARILGAQRNGTRQASGMMQSNAIQDFKIQKQAKEVGKVPTFDEKFRVEEAEFYARPMFVHSNLIKMDLRHLFDKPDVFVDQAGKKMRIWGSRDDVVDAFEYDLEQVLWNEMEDAACGMGGMTTECNAIRKHNREVFGMSLV
jgi:alpha 1,2-mannosyltransferase